MKKRKNRFIQNMTNTKGKKIILVFLGILLLNAIISLTTGFNFIVRAYNFLNALTNGYTKEVKSVTMENDSYKLDITADWINERQMKANYKLATKQETLLENKDIVFLFDNSMDSNLCEIKEEVKDQVLDLSKNNRISLATINQNIFSVFPFTQNEETITNGFANLDCSTIANRNYYAALQYIEDLEEEVYVLFFTSLPSNVNTMNEKAAYDYLKTKKPNVKIKIIVYENKNYKNENTEEIIYIDKENLTNLKYLVSSEESFDLFKIEQNLKQEYFTDFTMLTDQGHTSIENNNLIWYFDKELKKGETVNLEVIMTLNEAYYDTEGYYPFYNTISVKTQMPNEDIKEVKNNDKILLKNGYQVNFELNAPATCAINKNTSTMYHAYEIAELANDIPDCLGYTFKGWENEEDVTLINNRKFIMPTKDITIRGIWESVSIAKRLSITKVPYLVNFYVEDEKLEGQEKYIQLGENYGSLPVVEKTGYNFDGWYTKENELIKEATTLTKEEDHNLFAHFSAKSYAAVKTTYAAKGTTNSYNCNCTTNYRNKCVKAGGSCGSPELNVEANGGCTTGTNGVYYCACDRAGGVNVSCPYESCQTCTSTTYSCPNGGTLSGSTCTKYTCPNGGTLSGTTCVF